VRAYTKSVSNYQSLFGGTLTKIDYHLKRVLMNKKSLLGTIERVF